MKHFGLILLALLLLISCTERGNETMPVDVATTETSLQSPSGRYLLHVNEVDVGNDTMQFFDIQLPDGSVVFTAAEQYSKRHRTFFVWDEADRVWVYSGDVGTYVWTNQGDPAQWSVQSYRESGLPAPQVLKDLRPGYYNP